MPPRVLKKTSREQFQQQTAAGLGSERRSSKRVAAAKAFKSPASYNDEMTEEEALRLFNELPRRELEALFATVYRQSVDAAQILTVTKGSMVRRFEEEPPLFAKNSRSLGDLGVLPNERKSISSHVFVDG
jgi:hypothetical protein